MDNKQEKEEKMKKAHIIGHIPKLFTAVICRYQRGLYTMSSGWFLHILHRQADWTKRNCGCIETSIDTLQCFDTATVYFFHAAGYFLNVARSSRSLV